jgi:archaellum component FlaC
MVTDEQFRDLKSEIHDDSKALNDGMQKLGVYFERLVTRLDAEREGYKHLVQKVDRLDDRMELVCNDLSIVKADLNVVKDDVRAVKADLNVVKADLNVVKDDLNVVKDDVRGIKVKLRRRVR